MRHIFVTRPFRVLVALAPGNDYQYETLRLRWTIFVLAVISLVFLISTGVFVYTTGVLAWGFCPLVFFLTFAGLTQVAHRQTRFSKSNHPKNWQPDPSLAPENHGIRG